MANPPAIRAAKPRKEPANALPDADAVKRITSAIRLLRLPKRSLENPAQAAPIRHPSSNALAADLSVQTVERELPAWKTEVLR